MRGLGAASGSRAHYLIGYLMSQRRKAAEIVRSAVCLPSASTPPFTLGTSAHSVGSSMSKSYTRLPRYGRGHELPKLADFVAEVG